MAKKDKLKHKCFVCGKKMNDYERSMNCYQYGDQIACYDHTGIKQWYEEMCKKGDKSIIRPLRIVVSGK